MIGPEGAAVVLTWGAVVLFLGRPALRFLGGPPAFSSVALFFRGRRLVDELGVDELADAEEDAGGVGDAKTLGADAMNEPKGVVVAKEPPVRSGVSRAGARSGGFEDIVPPLIILYRA